MDKEDLQELKLKSISRGGNHRTYSYMAKEFTLVQWIEDDIIGINAPNII